MNVFLVAVLAFGTQGPHAVPTPGELELEVLENVRSQPLADGTVEDLALPEDFLRRIADRVVRASFEERYRIVVRDPSAVGPAAIETEKGVDADSPSRNPVLISVVALVLVILGVILVARRRDRNGP